MMSKAAFMMQEHLKRSYVMITDIHLPNTMVVRGRLPFPQGLTALSILFRQKKPADVYAHPYFIEKQSDPSQPSPQLHLTEESQGIMKVMSGIRYMRDDNSKLDNSMTVVTDFKVEVEGRVLVAPHLPNAMDPAGVPPSASPRPAESSAAASSMTLEQRALLRRPAATGNRVSPSPQDSLPAHQPSAPMQAGHEEVHYGYSSFPTPEECAANWLTTFRYFKAALFGRKVLKDEEEDAEHHGMIQLAPLFETRCGGYTVLYNPIEVNERTFVELLRRLEVEERVVKAIVVPTRHAWRHVQVWADAFPEAEVICSEALPLLGEEASVPLAYRSAISARTARHLSDERSSPLPATSACQRNSLTSNNGEGALNKQGEKPVAAPWRGGCEDMGNGVTGLSFPEVDLEELEAAAAAPVSPPPPPSSSAPTREDNHARADGNHGDGSRQRAMREAFDMKSRNEAVEPNNNEGKEKEDEREDEEEVEEDPVDVLWTAAPLFTEPSSQPIGLRPEDAHRVRVLGEPTHDGDAQALLSVVALTPTIELIHLPGDPTTNEYVLYDANSATLACTDLFHGAYGDLDPANSWMCRVWFKFMRGGDYRNTRLVPRYKWRQVVGQGNVRELQRAIDALTRTRPVKNLVYAHGTPPLCEAPANELRVQWGMPPLRSVELPVWRG